jgi:hypothetical protein
MPGAVGTSSPQAGHRATPALMGDWHLGQVDVIDSPPSAFVTCLTNRSPRERSARPLPKPPWGRRTQCSSQPRDAERAGRSNSAHRGLTFQIQLSCKLDASTNVVGVPKNIRDLSHYFPGIDRLVQPAHAPPLVVQVYTRESLSSFSPPLSRHCLAGRETEYPCLPDLLASRPRHSRPPPFCPHRSHSSSTISARSPAT